MYELHGFVTRFANVRIFLFCIDGTRLYDDTGQSNSTVTHIQIRFIN